MILSKLKPEALSIVVVPPPRPLSSHTLRWRQELGSNHKYRRRVSDFGGPGRSESGMDILERRLKKHLPRFDGAMECYYM